MSIKSIICRVTLEGQGIVNFDSKNQKDLYLKMGRNDIDTKRNFNNYTFAKKNFYVGDDGQLTCKIKISSNSIRNTIFSDAQMFHTTSTMSDDELLLIAVASPSAILRGYMHIPKSGTPIKRKSPINLIDAEQTNNAISHMEVGVRSGEKIMSNDPDGDSDVTLYHKESIGKITYESMCTIDLMEMQLLSSDTLFDRLGISEDMIDKYINAFKLRYPDMECTNGYFKMIGSDYDVPERGIKFSQMSINKFVNHFFKRLKSFDIQRQGAYVRVSKIEYKFVKDPLVDRFDNGDWVTFTDKLPEFTFNERYAEVDFETAKNKRCSISEKFNADVSKKIEQRNAEKEQQKEQRKIAKDKKKNPETTETAK